MTSLFLRLAVVLAIAGLCGFAAASEKPFSERPYRVLVQVTTDSPGFFQAAFAEMLVRRCETRSRGLWGLESAWQIPSEAEAVQESFQKPPETWEGFDKVFLVSCPESSKLVVREFDVTTRRWGEASQNEVEHPAKWVDVLVEALFRQFSPLVRLDKVSGDGAELLLRGVDLLPSGQVAGLLPEVGGVLLPLVRTEDAQGRCLAVAPIPWTALTVEELDFPSRSVRCRVESGLRDSLGGRRRGNTAVYGLAVPTPQRATTLRFQLRQGDGTMNRGLGVYDVFEALPGETNLRKIGQSDSEGRFVLEPDAARPVRICYVKSGNALLARLPVVRGLERELPVPVPDDPVRLRAEAALIGLQEEFIDTQARREILTLRLAKAGKDGDEKRSQPTRIELGKLKDRLRFLNELEMARQRYRSEDAAVQRRIDRMFRETKKVFEGK